MILFNILVLITAIPVGWFLAYLTRDELVSGKKWFKLILYILILILVIVILIWRDTSISFALGYMIIVTLVSLYLGKNKKFVKRN